MTEKLRHLQQKKFNAADELRDRLTWLEEQLIKIKQLNQVDALAMLTALDRVRQIIEQLTAAGANLAPEESRFDSIQRRLRKQAAPWLKAIGGPAALQQHLPVPSPPADDWWWQLDRIVAIRRHQRRKRATLVAAVLLFLVAGVIIALKTVLAPDPIVLAQLEAENDAGAALSVGDYDGALNAIETGLTAAPNSPNLLLFKAVVLDIMGDKSAAAAATAQARAAFINPVDFHLGLARLELQFGRPQQAEAQTRQALSLHETSALAWFTLGQTLERQDDRNGALAAYEKAAELAQANNDSELIVMIRMTLARLMMNPGG